MISVFPAEAAHSAALATMAEEMDRFYGATRLEPLETRLRQIEESLFGPTPLAHALLAWGDERPAGFASYSFLWPAVGLTKSLYLKELYVSEEFRNLGVGKLLMRRLFDVAVDRCCSRVEWTTDDDNPGAQAFYESLDLPKNSSKVFYRVDGRVPASLQ